jgi:hypothetical protein
MQITLQTDQIPGETRRAVGIATGEFINRILLNPVSRELLEKKKAELAGRRKSETVDMKRAGHGNARLEKGKKDAYSIQF